MKKDSPQAHKRPGMLMFLLAWITFLLLATFLFKAHFDFDPSSRQVISNMTSKYNEIVIPKYYNQFITPGQINGYDVTFLVDTGATSIGIPDSLIDKLQLTKGPEVPIETAAGLVKGNLSRIDSLTIGPIQLYDLSAMIIPAEKDSEVLLGMSALNRLNFSQQNDQLILRQPLPVP